MTTTLETRDVLASRDAGAVAKVLPVLSAVMKGWHRSEVHGMGNVPPGGALLVSNHSGGVLAVDVPIIAVSFAEHFGTYRPLAVLAHDNLFTGPLGPLLRRMGFLPAKPENAAAALRAGAATIVFPGGDYDAYRPTFAANKIDFKGRTGYIRTAKDYTNYVLRLDRSDRQHRWAGDPAGAHAWHSGGEAAWSQEGARLRAASAHRRLPVRTDACDAAQPPAAVEDHDAGPRADRPR